MGRYRELGFRSHFFGTALLRVIHVECLLAAEQRERGREAAADARTARIDRCVVDRPGRLRLSREMDLATLDRSIPVTRRSLLNILICSNLLSACVALDDGAMEEESTEISEVYLDPCAFIRPELAEIASDAAASLAANGTPGWSVFVSRRPAGGTAPCVATSSGGFARSALDGYRAFTPDVSFGVGSQSKLVTAAATVHILARHGISRTSSIAPYLPSDWQLGPLVSGITFAELLTHTSGLSNATSAATDAEREDKIYWMLRLGVVEPWKPRRYSNLGFGLLQMLAARIEYGPVVYFLDKLPYSGQMLASYVSNHFFSPHGIPAAGSPAPSCTFDTAGALAYPVGGTPTWGASPSQTTSYEGCGTGRWNFTTRNFGLFLDRLWNKQLLGEPLTGELMSANYGFGPTEGNYKTKGGTLLVGDTAFRSGSYIFPDGTVVVGFINGNAEFGSSIPDAYYAATEP